MRLSWKDVAHYDSTVRGFYQAIPKKGLLRAAAAAISLLVPGETTTAGLCINGVPTDAVYDPEFIPGDAAEVGEVVMRDHPVIFQRLRGPRAISDATTRLRWQRTEMSSLMTRLCGADDDLGLDSVLAPGVVLNSCVVRRWGRMTERDRMMIALLRPHFIAGYRLDGALAAVDRFCGGDWTKALGAGVISLDASTRVSVWSEETRGTVARAFGRKVSSVRDLPEELKAWVLRQRMASLNGGSGVGARKPLLKISGGECTEFHFLQDAGLGRDFVVVRPGREVSDRSDMSVLSRREREIASRAGSGLRNRELACELGISEATVKRHLENIYAKLGVRGRTELLARIRA